MIVALLGEPSFLKTRIREHLLEKGFHPCPPDPVSRLDHDRNYLVEPGSAESLSPFPDLRPFLIRVGDASSLPAGAVADFQVDAQSPVEAALEQISARVLAQLQAQFRPDWDEYFMKIAQVAAMRSNCIKRKVGAVIVRDKRIISTGYNGTPRGTRNCNEGGCPRCNSLADSGTRLDECLCSHAEENAITQSAYHGTSVKDATIYTTFAPCLMCSKMIINSGIIEVVFNVNYPLNDMAFRLFEQAGVRVRQLKLP